jgi:hypothetical protein
MDSPTADTPQERQDKADVLALLERVATLERALETALDQFEADCPELAAEIRSDANL